jgi:hypothetical protein
MTGPFTRITLIPQQGRDLQPLFSWQVNGREYRDISGKEKGSPVKKKYSRFFGYTGTFPRNLNN